MKQHSSTCSSPASNTLVAHAPCLIGPSLIARCTRRASRCNCYGEEYVEAHRGVVTYRYTQFCQLYHDYAATLKRSMRQIHRAGEKLFIDYAGPTVPIIDQRSGEISQAHIFVAVLGASNYTYACATVR